MQYASSHAVQSQILTMRFVQTLLLKNILALTILPSLQRHKLGMDWNRMVSALKTHITEVQINEKILKDLMFKI